MKSFIALYISFMLIITVIAGATGKLISVDKDNADNGFGDLWGDASREESEGLSFIMNEDGYSYSVNGLGNCTDSDVVIPSEHYGYPVTGIYDQAFFDMRNVTSVYIPASVKSIGYLSFALCYDLKLVRMEEGVERIGEGAFYECESLTKVELPSSVTYVGADAFGACENLSRFEYYGCYYLGSEQNPYHLLYDADETLAGVIDLHSDTKVIGSGAFQDCEYLTEVYMYDSVEHIGDYAFCSCYDLKYVSCGGNLASIGVYAFAEDYYLEGVYLGESLTELPENLFMNCYSLQRIDLPYSIEKIGKCAFYYCERLPSISLSSNLKSIEESAFYGCSSLYAVENIDGLEYIGPYAFRDCTSLSNLFLYGSLHTIGTYAFGGCYNLRQIDYYGYSEDWNMVYRDYAWWANGYDENYVYCWDGIYLAN